MIDYESFLKSVAIRKSVSFKQHFVVPSGKLPPFRRKRAVEEDFVPEEFPIECRSCSWKSIIEAAVGSRRFIRLHLCGGFYRDLTAIKHCDELTRQLRLHNEVEAVVRCFHRIDRQKILRQLPERRSGEESASLSVERFRTVVESDESFSIAQTSTEEKQESSSEDGRRSDVVISSIQGGEANEIRCSLALEHVISQPDEEETPPFKARGRRRYAKINKADTSNVDSEKELVEEESDGQEEVEEEEDRIFMMTEESVKESGGTGGGIRRRKARQKRLVIFVLDNVDYVRNVEWRDLFEIIKDLHRVDREIAVLIIGLYVRSVETVHGVLPLDVWSYTSLSWSFRPQEEIMPRRLESSLSGMMLTRVPSRQNRSCNVPLLMEFIRTLKQLKYSSPKVRYVNAAQLFAIIHVRRGDSSSNDAVHCDICKCLRCSLQTFLLTAYTLSRMGLIRVDLKRQDQWLNRSVQASQKSIAALINLAHLDLD